MRIRCLERSISIQGKRKDRTMLKAFSVSAMQRDAIKKVKPE